MAAYIVKSYQISGVALSTLHALFYFFITKSNEFDATIHTHFANKVTIISGLENLK